MLGGGQLGRMFTVAALQMGYKVTVLDPDPQSPAGMLASTHIQAAYDDAAALDQLASCDAVSIEFENIPVSSLAALDKRTRVSPPASAVQIAQDRNAEKSFAKRHGIDTAEYAFITTVDEAKTASLAINAPSIMKTARLGYDGKGQIVCSSGKDVMQAFESLGGVACVLERKVDLAIELSVVLARGRSGETAIFPVAENIHENGILKFSIAPARVEKEQALKAVEMAVKLAEALEYVGVLAVEFFVTRDGRVLMNELAPRPHNSGHYTLDAVGVSQFDAQVLSMCGLPLPSFEAALCSPVVMLNLLGDRWAQGQPAWETLFKQHAQVSSSADVLPRLHLYGKGEARSGRKMGHVNFLANDLDAALAAAESADTSL